MPDLHIHGLFPGRWRGTESKLGAGKRTSQETTLLWIENVHRIQETDKGARGTHVRGDFIADPIEGPCLQCELAELVGLHFSLPLLLFAASLASS